MVLTTFAGLMGISFGVLILQEGLEVGTAASVQNKFFNRFHGYGIKFTFVDGLKVTLYLDCFAV